MQKLHAGRSNFSKNTILTITSPNSYVVVEGAHAIKPCQEAEAIWIMDYACSISYQSLLQHRTATLYVPAKMPIISVIQVRTFWVIRNIYNYVQHFRTKIP